MKLNEDDIPEFVKELRGLLTSLKGVKSYNETLSLSYVLVVENEQDKENIVKVANLLTEQAAKSHGVDLEIVPATVDEVQQAADAFKQHQAAQGSFRI